MVDSPGSNEKVMDFYLMDTYMPSQEGIAQQGDRAGGEHASYDQTSSTAWAPMHFVEPDGAMEFIQPANDVIQYAHHSGSAVPELRTPLLNDVDMGVAHQMDLHSESRHVYGGQLAPVREFNPRAVQPSQPPTLGEVNCQAGIPAMQPTYGFAGQHNYPAPVDTGNSSSIQHVTAVSTRKRQQTSTRKKTAPASGIDQQQSREEQVSGCSQRHVANKASTSRVRKPRRQPTFDPITGEEILVSTRHPKGCPCAYCKEHRANNAKNSRNHATRQKNEIARLTALVKLLDAQLAVEKAKNVKLESRLSFAAEKRLEKRIAEMEKRLKEHMETLIRDAPAVSANSTTSGKVAKGQSKRAEPSSRQARASSPTPQQDPMTCSANVNDFHAT